jgi:hypothetical protein
MRRHFVHGDSIRNAIDYVNGQSGKLANSCLLTKDTLHRMIVALPAALRLADEVAVLEWLHDFELQRRAQLSTSIAERNGQKLFSKVEEEVIAQWMCVMSSVNLAVGKSAVITRAHGVLLARPGLTATDLASIEATTLRGWYRGFTRRQPGLTQRRERFVTPSRLIAEKQAKNIAHFFELLRQFKDYTAAQVYAGDETGLTGDGSRPGLVWTQIGVKQVSSPKKRTQGHIGLMHIGNAEGKSCPPIVVYKSAYLTEAHLSALPPGSLVGTQENGHFLGIHFRRVLDHIIAHAMQPGGVWDCPVAERKPVLFIVDGCSAHTDPDAIVWAKSEKLDIICLPSHTTHILQVADVSLFAPFKRYWSEGCSRCLAQNRGELGPVAMTIDVVVPTLVRAWERAMTAENVKAGFLRTGMFPFNPEAHKEFDASRLGSLGGLPLLVSSKPDLLRSSSISAVVQSCDDAVPSPPQPKAKKRRPTKLSTEAGLLLTGEEALGLIRAKEAAKEAEAAALAARKEARVAKATQVAADKVEAKAARELARTQKAEAKATEAAAKALAGFLRPSTKRREKKVADGLPAVDGGGAEQTVVGPVGQLVFLSEVALAGVMAKKGPGALEARQRKVEQRARERAAAAAAVEVERSAAAVSGEAENTGKGQKRRAAQAIESGKENTHSHNTRAKAARTQERENGLSMGVRRPLQPLLNRSM